MQRDTELTFGDIHESEEALLSCIEHIEQIALVEVSDDAPLQLRFLTPYEDTERSNSFSDFALTPASICPPGAAYVAVSYTWAQSQSTEELNIPTYWIWDISPEGDPIGRRRLKCPPAVFDRAMRFAQSRECPYVWIDQECIDQSDAADIEKHLQVMDRIYRESRHTVAILSCNLPNATVLNNFANAVDIIRQTLGGNDCDPPRESNALERFLRVLMHVARDRWFTRTWTFHEKWCATTLDLLLPTTAASALEERYKYMLVGNDICLNMREIDLFLHAPPPEAPRHLFEGKLDAFHHKEVYIPKEPQDTLANTMSLIHKWMERCDNTYTSDRLAIFANVCNLHKKLQTTLLESPEYSHATCLLVLIMINIYPEREERVEKYQQLIEDENLMEANVEMLLDYLVTMGWALVRVEEEA